MIFSTTSAWVARGEWLMRSGMRKSSALDDIDRQPAAGRLFVFDLHVRAGLHHGFDHFVQADGVPAIAMEGEPRRGDGLDRSDGVPLNARNLDQATHWITGKP